MNMVRSIMRTIVLSLVLPAVLMLGAIAAYEYINTVNIYKTSMAYLVTRVNTGVESYMNGIVGNTKTRIEPGMFGDFFKNPNNDALRKKVETELAKVDAYSTFVEKTVLTDEGGFIIAGGFKNSAEYFNQTKFDKAKRTGNAVIDSTFTIFNGKPVFTVYAPVHLESSEGSVFVVQWINIGFLDSLVSMYTETDNERLYIIDTDSNVIGYGNSKEMSKLAAFNNPNGLLQNMKNVMSWTTDEVHDITYTNEQNEKVTAVFIRNPEYDITVVTEMNNSHILKSVSVIRIILFSFMGILVAIGIGACIVVQRKIKPPLDVALTTMSEYENGNFSYRPVITGNDEISNITASLWNMAMKISDIYDDIRENEYCYRKSMEFVSDMITDYSVSKNTFVSDNEKWFNMFGFEFVGNEKQMYSELYGRVHIEDRNKFKQYRDKMFADIYENREKHMQLEFRMKLKDGEFHWILRRDILVKGKTDDIEHILGSFANIDDRKKNELELSSKAHHDQLTKLFNRSTFMTKAKEWMKANDTKSCAMIFVDADNFKHVNDTYGHDAGDDVICYIADTIRAAVGDRGICGRYGGDEFLMFVYNAADAIEAAQYVIENLPKDYTVPSKSDVVLSMHSSIGIAYYPDHAYDAENLLKRADEAMYVSKKSGKDRYTVFDNSIKL